MIKHILICFPTVVTLQNPHYALKVKRQSHDVAVLSVCLAIQMFSFLFAFKADENVPPPTQTEVYKETRTSASKYYFLKILLNV